MYVATLGAIFTQELKNMLAAMLLSSVHHGHMGCGLLKTGTAKA